VRSGFIVGCCCFCGALFMGCGVEEVVGGLRFGDLVQIDWLDASEARGRLEKVSFDMLVCSVGWFLGLKGHKTPIWLLLRSLFAGLVLFIIMLFLWVWWRV